LAAAPLTAGPTIVRNENRIDRIRRIVLDAGGLTSDKPLESHLLSSPVMSWPVWYVTPEIE